MADFRSKLQWQLLAVDCHRQSFHNLLGILVSRLFNGFASLRDLPHPLKHYESAWPCRFGRSSL
jgi:hypothetical protein